MLQKSLLQCRDLSIFAHSEQQSAQHLLKSRTLRASAGALRRSKRPLWKRCPRSSPSMLARSSYSGAREGASMSSSLSFRRKPCIYLGFRTAFQIARAVGTANLIPLRGSMGKPPICAPSQREIADALEHLESEYPELHLIKPVSLLVGGAAQSRATSLCKPHSCSFQLSDESFYRVSDSVCIASPALSLMQLAAKNDMISLLECENELCGTYQTTRTAASSAYQVPRLSSTHTVRSYALRNKSANGAQKVLRSLRYLADDSASPRETKQALVLGLPQMYGGYGLGIPCMNFEVTANPAARLLTGKFHFRCDLCWPEAKIDVEYQSRKMHEGEVNRIRDSLRSNALAAMGWTVLGITNVELDSLAAMDTIANTIRRLLGKRAQVRVDNYHERKLKLRRKLGLPVESTYLL